MYTHKHTKKIIYIYICGKKCVFKDIFGKNICSSLCRKEGCVGVCEREREITPGGVVTTGHAQGERAQARLSDTATAWQSQSKTKGSPPSLL